MEVRWWIDWLIVELQMLDSAVRDTMGLNLLWLDHAKGNYDGFSIPSHNNRSKDYSLVSRKPLALNRSDQTQSEFDNLHRGP
jgi:hypothetical protein